MSELNGVSRGYFTRDRLLRYETYRPMVQVRFSHHTFMVRVCSP